MPAYTVTAADAGAPTPANAVATSYASWLNNSDIVNGFFANWNTCVASGNTVALSINVPSDATTPTYSVSSTGTTVVSPTATTAVTGGSRLKNPVSQVFSVSNCQVTQAEYKPSKGVSYASTEGVHIDGAVTSVSVNEFGTTGVHYGVRFANANSGSDANPNLISIKGASFDHTHFCSISHESGNLVSITDVKIIANFGAGPPPTSYAINIAPTAGGAEIRDCEISHCDSGGIGIGNGPVYIDNCRIFQVGRHYLSDINFYGSNAIVGIGIRNCALGAPNLATGGNGTNMYGIDFVGPGTLFTGTIQSVTIQNNAITGSAGAINLGTVISDALTAFGLGAYNTIKNNPGYNPTLSVSQPSPPAAASPGNLVLNPFACDCLVWVIPAGGATITSIAIATNDGDNILTVSYTGAFPVFVPANAGIILTFTSGTVTWNWYPS